MRSWCWGKRTAYLWGNGVCEVMEVAYPRLRDLREDRELMQKQVAAYLGIDQRVYSNYETGKREIPTRLVIALADFYHTSTDYILGRTNRTEPYKD